MSIKLITKVFEDKSLTSTQTLIMVAMSDNANDDGICYPKLENIMAKTKLGRTSVVNNLKILEEKEILQKTFRAKKKGGRYSNIYLLYPIENYANLDGAFAEYFTPVSSSQSSLDGTEIKDSQSSLDGTERGSQSSLDGTELTISEPSLKIEPSLKSVTSAENVANYLLLKITKNNPEFRVQNISIWINDIDKAMRLDGRSKVQLLNCIDWIYNNPKGAFWIPNILSGKKLRDKFNTMSMQANQGNAKNDALEKNLKMMEGIINAS